MQSFRLFGWGLETRNHDDLAYHVGIILDWNPINPGDSIVIHYGSNCKSEIRIESLSSVCINSNVISICLKYDITPGPKFYNRFIYDNNRVYVPDNILKEYQLKYHTYNILTSNCQIFCRDFLDTHIDIQTDKIYNSYNDKNDINILTLLALYIKVRYIDENKYEDIKNTSICNWNYYMYTYDWYLIPIDLCILPIK